MHFGLEEYVPIPYVLYCGAIVALLLSLFWRPIVGLYYLVPLIPLQTIRYALNDFPLGQSVVDIILLSVAVGLIRQGGSLCPKTPLNRLLAAYAIYTFVSLCAGSWYLNVPLPLSPSDPRLADWKCYFTLPAIFLLVIATVRDTSQMRVLVMLMCISVLMLDRNYWSTISERDFSSYSDDLRNEGALGYAGVNGLAAFQAQFASALLALAAFERKKLLLCGYIGLASFSVICLMYSLSRGGYAAFLVGWLFIGLTKNRKLLILLAAFLVLWAGVVPNAVRERVTMTYKTNGSFEPSTETRMRLWNDALQVVQSNPLFGTGFNTYAYMGRIGSYQDTHNIYLKVMVETGLIGLLLFLALLCGLFKAGWSLFRQDGDPFLRSLGLALAAWIVCTAAANLFGDRWTYLQVNGYLWILAGCVYRGLALQASESEEYAGMEETATLLPAHAGMAAL